MFSHRVYPSGTHGERCTIGDKREFGDPEAAREMSGLARGYRAVQKQDGPSRAAAGATWGSAPASGGLWGRRSMEAMFQIADCSRLAKNSAGCGEDIGQSLARIGQSALGTDRGGTYAVLLGG